MSKNWLLVAMLAFGVLMMTPGAARANCSSPTGSAGAFIYNSAIKTFQYCNGTNWIRTTKAGTGSGGCTNPTKNEGDLVYNKDYRKLQGCAGGAWHAMNAGNTGSGTGGGGAWSDVSGLCGLKTDGTLWCWGGGYQGQLGNGSSGWGYYVDSPVTVSVSGVSGTKWTSISYGSAVCALRDDGTAWCWGDNSNGEIGNASTSNASTPQAVTVAGVSGTKWTQLRTSAWDNHSCGLRDDGTLWCWGSNSHGQLGDGTTTQSTTPVEVSTTGVSGTAWTAVDVGSTSCGLRDDATMWCWGPNGNGELGNGSSADSSTPVAVSTTGVSGSNWSSISVGELNACGIRDDGTGWCWGEDAAGELGTGDGSSINVPHVLLTTGVTGSNWSKIFFGYDTACAVRDDGSGYCWGQNGSAGVGDGTFTDHNHPVAISTTGVTGASWLAISPGYSQTCGVRNDGSMYCWGTANSTVNLGPAVPRDHFAAIEASTSGATGTSWVSVDAGGFNAYAIRDDGTGYSWGQDDCGAADLGQGWTGMTYVPTSINVTANSVSGSKWIKLMGGDVCSGGCGLRDDGTIWCWGKDNHGQLGDGSTSQKIYPAPGATAGSPSGTTWTDVEYSGFSACGIRDDGTGYCWGDDTYGQLGNNTTGSLQSSPVSIDLTNVTGTKWTQLSRGVQHTCGLRDDGTGYCWGDNTYGQVGDNSTTQRLVPVPIDTTGVTGTKWTALSGGSTHSCGIRNNGTAWCWGDNGHGELGNNSTTQSLVPVAVQSTGLNGLIWTNIYANSGYSCGIRDNGAGYCWGYNANGRLGTGEDTTAQYTVPIRVSTDGVSGSKWTGFVDGAPQGTNCGIRNDGTMWCWGYTRYGTVGSLGVGYSGTPVSQWCGEPSGAPGQIIFNATSNKVELCTGVGWVDLGK